MKKRRLTLSVLTPSLDVLDRKNLLSRDSCIREGLSKRALCCQTYHLNNCFPLADLTIPTSSDKHFCDKFEWRNNRLMAFLYARGEKSLGPWLLLLIVDYSRIQRIADSPLPHLRHKALCGGTFELLSRNLNKTFANRVLLFATTLTKLALIPRAATSQGVVDRNSALKSKNIIS